MVFKNTKLKQNFNFISQRIESCKLFFQGNYNKNNNDVHFSPAQKLIEILDEIFSIVFPFSN